MAPELAMTEFVVSGQVAVRLGSGIRVDYRLPATSMIEDIAPWTEAELLLGTRIPVAVVPYRRGRMLVAEAGRALALALTGVLVVSAAAVSSAALIARVAGI